MHVTGTHFIDAPPQSLVPVRWRGVVNSLSGGTAGQDVTAYAICRK